MDDIRRVLTAASKRLFLIDLLKTLAITVTAALVAMVLARIGQKLFPFELPWSWVFPIGAGAAVVAALAWSAVRRAREQEVARAVDERAGLRESISTALCVAPAKTAWSDAVVEQAGERARRVVVRDAIPITPPRVWPAALGAALALAIVWWLPSYDVAGLFAQRQAAEEEQREIQQVMGEVRASEKKLEDLLASTSVDVGDDEADDEGDDDADLDEPTRADEVRRAAIKKLTKLSDKIKQAQDGEKSARLEALKQSLLRLREPGEGPMTEFARQLSRGNFADAKKQLREMSEQLSAGELDEEEAKKLKKQLESLAKQMDTLAKSREQLEQKLQEAGLSEEQARQAAQDPSKMSEMLEQNAPALSSEMMNQLSQMAQAQQNASESMQSMSQAMQQMAQSMSEQSMGQEGAQSMESLSEQLSSMEMAQGEMEALESAMSEIESQMSQMSQGMGECASCGGECSGDCGAGNGSWSEGDATAQGDGSGGPGRGYGESPGERPVDFMLEKKKQKVANQGGPTIGSTLVFGSQVRGESVAQFESAVGQGRAEAAEAIETRRIPREYERAVQHYFGRLEARAKAQRAGEDAPNADD